MPCENMPVRLTSERKREREMIIMSEICSENVIRV
jgi:hypothetical protein